MTIGKFFIKTCIQQICINDILSLCQSLWVKNDGFLMFLKSPQSYWGCCCLVAKLMYNSSAAPWTVTWQAPLFLGFPRQEYWSGLPFPSSGDLPDPGMEPTSPALAGGFLPLSHLGSLSGVEDIYIYIYKTQNNGNNTDYNADKGNSIVCPIYRRGRISRTRYQVSQMFNWCLISWDLGLILG